MKRNSLQPIIIGLTILIFIIVIVTIILYNKPKKEGKKEGKKDVESYNGYEQDPHTLDKGFKVTGQKLCSGGPYMVSSAPEEVKQSCYNYSYDDISKHDCTVSGWNGQPTSFVRTIMSNDTWKNEMC